ncbi:hypothetical protein B296_00008832, partial [Ensete ventricosum]
MLNDLQMCRSHYLVVASMILRIEAEKGVIVINRSLLVYPCIQLHMIVTFSDRKLLDAVMNLLIDIYFSQHTSQVTFNGSFDHMNIDAT